MRPRMVRRCFRQQKAQLGIEFVLGVELARHEPIPQGVGTRVALIDIMQRAVNWHYAGLLQHLQLSFGASLRRPERHRRCCHQEGW